MKTLKLLFAAGAAAMMTLTAQAAKTAKVVVEDSGKTLRFVCDEKSYGTEGSDWYAVPEASPAANPPWFSRRLTAEKAVFDDSFRSCQPKHCGNWFRSCTRLKTVEGIENLDTSRATSLEGMFCNCKALEALDLSRFETANVTNMAQMLFKCELLEELHLETFDTANVEQMAEMFSGCKALTTIYVSDGFVTTKASYEATGTHANWKNMFYNCLHLVGGEGTEYDLMGVQNGFYARIDGGLASETPGYFTGVEVSRTPKAVVEDSGGRLRFVCDAVPHGVRGKDWFAVDADAAWSVCKEMVTNVVFDKTFAEFRPTKCRSWFKNFTKLQTIDGISYLNTSQVTDMCGMFMVCSHLESLDVSGFDTSQVTDMSYMFNSCMNLTVLDVSGFDTSQVTDMKYMFNNCLSLTALDVSGFDTSQVTDMQYLFCDCMALATLDVSHFDTSKVTNMENLFGSCLLLTVLDVSRFDTSRVTCMRSMFGGCSALPELDVSTLDTSLVTSMEYMFGGCRSLKTLDLSRFNTSKVTTTVRMFYGCSLLVTIHVSAGFVTDSVDVSYRMFYECSSLVGGKGTAFDSSETDVAYARIDGGPAAPGYFTEKAPVPVNSYHIRHLSGGGTGTMEDRVCECGKVYTLSECVFTPPSGRKFAGWLGDNGKRYDDGVLFFNLAEPGETVTMTAFWE